LPKFGGFDARVYVIGNPWLLVNSDRITEPLLLTNQAEL
jgi:hypothetical protein